MVLVEFLGRQFQVVNGPGTTPNGNLVLRKAPPWAGANSAEELVGAMSQPQVRAIVALGSWASANLEGETGTTRFRGQRVPRAAAKMAREFPNTGQGAFGGLSDDERRRQAAEERISVNDIDQAAPFNTQG